MDHHKRIPLDPTPNQNEPTLEAGSVPFRNIGQFENANSSFLCRESYSNFLKIAEKAFIKGMLPSGRTVQDIKLHFALFKLGLIEVICFEKGQTHIDTSPENQKKQLHELLNRASSESLAALAEKSLIHLKQDSAIAKEILVALQRNDQSSLADMLSGLYCSSMEDIDLVFLLASFLTQHPHLLVDVPHELLSKYHTNYRILDSDLRDLEAQIVKLRAPPETTEDTTIPSPVEITHKFYTSQAPPLKPPTQAISLIPYKFENLFSNEEFRAFIKKAQEALGRALHAFADGVAKDKQEKRQKSLECDARVEKRARARADEVLGDFPELANTPVGVSLKQNKFVRPPSDARIKEAEILGERLRLLKETEHKT